MSILPAALGRMGLGASLWWLMAALVAISGTGGAWVGYKLTDNHWRAAQARALQDHQAAIITLATQIRDREAQAAGRANQRDVVIKEITKYVPHAIDTGTCRLTPDGLRAVRDAATRLSAPAQ